MSTRSPSPIVVSGRKAVVDAFSPAEAGFGGEPRHDGAAPGVGRAIGQDGGGRRPREALGERRVVAVGVRHEDRAHLGSAEDAQQCVEVAGVVGAGVDHRHPTLAHQIRVGAPVRHGRRVGREDEADAGFELHRAAGVGAIHVLFLSGPRLTTFGAMKLDWLKAYAPRSLMGRAALILLLPIVTIQLVVGVVFIQRHYENVTRQMTRNIMLDIGYVAGLIDERAGRRRRTGGDRGARAGRLGWRRGSRDGPEGVARHWYDLSGQAIEETLAEMPGLTGVDLVADDGEVIFGLRTNSR